MKKNKNSMALRTIALVVLLAALTCIIILRFKAPNDSPNIDPSEDYMDDPPQQEEPEPEEVFIVLGGKIIDPSVANLQLEPEVTVNELESVIPELKFLEIVDAQQCLFSDTEKRKLIADHPDVQFLWDICIGDLVCSSEQTSLSIPDPECIDEYTAFADLLPNIMVIELCGGDYTPQQASSIAAAWPGAHLTGMLTMFGQSFSTDTEELDFSGTPISLEQTEEFSSLISAMPALKKVVMSDCGIKDEDMDALDQKYESVRFVWTVHFKVYSVRTDTDRFCVSDLPWNNYVAWPMTDKDFAPIKYCRDLVALDLGHENISDLSFLYNMPKLRYLIIAIEHNIFDLTPVASLQDLYYLEVFNNELLDISPLAECKNLKHLNISNTRGDFSIEPLFQMTQLDRLWFALNHLTEEEKEALRTALPDTEIYLEQDDSVGGSWRSSPVYDELRTALFAPGH